MLLFLGRRLGHSLFLWVVSFKSFGANPLQMAKRYEVLPLWGELLVKFLLYSLTLFGALWMNRLPLAVAIVVVTWLYFRVPSFRYKSVMVLGRLVGKKFIAGERH